MPLDRYVCFGQVSVGDEVVVVVVAVEWERMSSEDDRIKMMMVL